MQVNVTANGLERRMTVAVPAEQINEEVQSRLKSLTRRVRIDGFRPGKVPLKVVERRYGGSVRQEVQHELVQSSFSEAVTQEKLRVAGMPNFEFAPEDSAEGLSYTATFEVYPEIEIKVPSPLKIEKPKVEISPADIDQMIDKLRKQRTSWESVERAAENGDRVTIDFKGTVEGNDFPGNTAEAFPVVLGSGALIEGFEKHLTGLKAGEEAGFDVDFPAEYRAQDLAGKTAHFDVKVVSVSAAKLPDIDAEFMKSFGLAAGSVEALHQEVKGTMQRELDQAVKDKVKQQVMDALLESNPMDIPNSLIEEEVQRLSQEASQFDASGEEAQKALAERARRRVALGLIIAEVIKKHQFKVAPDQLRATVEQMAATYERPEEVVQWYYAKRERLSGVEALLLEDQAVDWVLGQADVTDKSASFEELVGATQG